MALPAIIGLVGGLANTINGIFQGNKANKAAIELKQQEQQFSQSISQLSNQQQYFLQSQLNNAKNDTERYAILTNSVLQIKLNQQTNASKSSNTTAILIVAVLVVAVVVLIVVKRK